MSNTNDAKPFKKLSKLERERAMYERCGVQHPSDAAAEFQLRYLRNWLGKLPRMKRPPE